MGGDSFWRVVGGADKGGILVRRDRDLNSPQLPTRLSTGACVKELCLVGDRLQFERVTGGGPAVGWVSIRVTGKDLLVRADLPAELPVEVGREPAGAAAAAPAGPEGPGSGPPARVFEVRRAAVTVHEEPHVEARVLGIKARGTKVICTEVTMNGWLRLAGEDGWMLLRMHGATPGLSECARLIGEEGQLLASAEHHPQGLCCFEVASRDPLEVRGAPSASGPRTALGSRRPGELVFAHSQTFDGWVRLRGEAGWMQAISSSSTSRGQEAAAAVELLRPRAPATLEHVDLWALCEAWTAARRHRGGKPLGVEDVAALKRLEQAVAEMTLNRYSEYSIQGDGTPLIAAGLLTERQLHQPPSWVKQTLFASLLRNTVEQVPAYKAVVGKLGEHVRVPPLPAAEEDQLGHMGFWSAACLPVDFDGTTYMMAPNGLMIDLNSQEPVACWDPVTQEATPVAMVQQGEDTYFMSADGTLLDPLTLEQVGTVSPDTHCVEPVGATDARELDIREPAEEVEECTLAVAHRHLQWAHQNAKRRCWNMAVDAYSKALEACAGAKAVDLEVEQQILLGRAECWQHLERYEDLRADTERLLAIGSQETDPQIQEWLRLVRAGRSAGPLEQIASGRRPDRGHPRPAAAAARVDEASYLPDLLSSPPSELAPTEGRRLGLAA